MTGCVARKIKYTDEYTGNNWSTVPCILVEMGYSSNATEDKLLNSPAYQEKIVKGLINGICRYNGIELPY
jgi:N-acetylmuramoyl-L-alanine amidase